MQQGSVCAAGLCVCTWAVCARVLCLQYGWVLCYAAGLSLCYAVDLHAPVFDLHAQVLFPSAGIQQLGSCTHG